MHVVTDPAEMTPEWVTESLRAAGTLAHGRVVAVQPEPVGTGQMGDSIRLALTYDPEGAGPRSLVAKVSAADEVSRATGVSMRGYEKEVRFYQQLAPRLPVRTPTCHRAELELESGRFVLLLDDLAPARQGDQIAGCDLRTAAAVIDEAVRLHAPLWGDPSLGERDWLSPRSPDEAELLAQFVEQLWPAFCDRYRERLDAEVLEVGEGLVGAMRSFLGSRERRPATLVHGDFRLDNLMFGSDGTVTVLDWQTVGVGVGTGDVAYFLGAGLPPEQREQAEVELVEGYHRALQEAGVGDYGWDECWHDYRVMALSGLNMAILASMIVARTQRGDEMFMTMAARHARQARHLDSLALLT